MSRRFVVVSEAQADFAIGTEVADRVLIEQVDWLDESLLDSQRQWIGEDPTGVRLTWKSIPSRARNAGIRVRGHFAGKPGLPDARAARRAIAFVRKQFGDVDTIVLIRDQDGQIERRQGLEQARDLYSSGCTFVIGLAICERECWVICGFQPADQNESERLETERRNLGWDPCLRSEELSAGRDDHALRSPKRVLAALSKGDWERERDCWISTPLDVLRERGARNGLADYLNEIVSRLAPMTTGRSRET